MDNATLLGFAVVGIVLYGLSAVLRVAVDAKTLFWGQRGDPITRAEHEALRDGHQALKTEHAVLAASVREQMLPLLQETRSEQHDMHRTLARLVVGVEELRRARQSPRIYTPPAEGDEPGEPKK